MHIAIEIPETVASDIQTRGGDLSRRTLEALAVDAFRSGEISSLQVQQMLGFSSRWETEQFLGRNKVWPRYTVEDLEQDIETVKRLFPS